MIISQNDYERQGNSNSPRRKGRVKEAKLGVFVQFMIKNYNKVELAVLREWVSNAYDSHRMAGQSKPVRVTIPSAFSNMLVVQDFGLGMSYDELVNGFGVILESTKDEDNEGIGGYGIGGKAALALADQFTVVSIKDGLKNIVIFESDARTGFEILEVVTDQPTDEANGVTMSVAVENPDAFKDANSVLEGWQSHELEIVNGEFSSFYDDTIELPSGLVKSHIFEPDTQESARSYYRWKDYKRAKVFVGPVAYSLPDSHENYFSWINEDKYAIALKFMSHMAIRLPIGSVSFPSSREVIENNAKNNMLISDTFKSLADEILQHMKDNFMRFDSLEEAWAFRNSTLAKELNLEVSYEKRKLNIVAIEDMTYLLSPQLRRSNDGSHSYSLNSLDVDSASFHPSAYDYNRVPGQNIDSISMIVRVNDSENTPSLSVLRKHLRAYLDKKIKDSNVELRNFEGLNKSIVVLSDREIDPLWAVAGIEVVDYADLQKFSKSIEAKSASTRKKTTPEERRANVGTIAVRVARRAQSSSGAYRNDYGLSSMKLSGALKEANDKLVLVSGVDTRASDIVVLAHLLKLDVTQIAIVLRKRDRERIVANFSEVSMLEDHLAALSTGDLARIRARFAYLNRIRADLHLGSSYERDEFKRLMGHENASETLKNLLSEDDIFLASNISDSLLKAGENVGETIQVSDPYSLRGNIQQSPMTLYSLSYRLNDHDHFNDTLDYLNLVAPRYKEKLDTIKGASV